MPRGKRVIRGTCHNVSGVVLERPVLIEKGMCHELPSYVSASGFNGFAGGFPLGRRPALSATGLLHAGRRAAGRRAAGRRPAGRLAAGDGDTVALNVTDFGSGGNGPPLPSCRAVVAHAQRKRKVSDDIEGYSGSRLVMRSLFLVAERRNNKDDLFMKGFSYHTSS
jgi:hypothetical protein